MNVHSLPIESTRRKKYNYKTNEHYLKLCPINDCKGTVKNQNAFLNYLQMGQGASEKLDLDGSYCKLTDSEFSVFECLIL